MWKEESLLWKKETRMLSVFSGLQRVSVRPLHACRDECESVCKRLKSAEEGSHAEPPVCELSNTTRPHKDATHTHTHSHNAKNGRGIDVCYGKRVLVLVLLVDQVSWLHPPNCQRFLQV